MIAGNDSHAGARSARPLLGGPTDPAGEVTASFPASPPPVANPRPLTSPAAKRWKPAPPLLTSLNKPASRPPPIERIMEGVYRWRTVLGIGLAATMTAAIVIAYWARSGPGIEPLASGTASTAVASPESGPTPLSSDAPVAEAGPSPSIGSVVDSTAPNEQTTAESTTPPTTATITSAVASELPPTSQAVESSTTDPRPETTSSTDLGTESTSSTTIPTTTPTSGPLDTNPTTTSSMVATTSATSTPTSVGPSTTPSTVQATRVEAETAKLLGQAQARSDHGGFSGTGFVGDIITLGSGLELTVDSKTAGQIPFQVRYSAGEVTNKSGPRTLTVLVNGTRVTAASMALTTDWANWDFVVGELPLELGSNTISLVWADGDTGWVNIDYVQIN